MVSSEFVLRIATHADVPALNLLIEQSVRGLQAGDYTQEQIEGALGHALGLDTQLIEDGTYFAAVPVDGPGRIAGCGGWSYRKTAFGSDHGPGRDMGPLDPATEAAKIRAIFVHPDYVRRGLGTMILGHCERAAQAAGFRAFEMGSTLTGVPLYTLQGYRETERIEVALPNGSALPILRMRKVPEV
ncbi:MAG: GNAT family N-acetyltransferase [Acidobacteriota bacterium]|nr:GNAT family N-acetyltransferase [Acidobacteriota bacterium]